MEKKNELPVTIQDVRRAASSVDSSLVYLNYLQKKIKTFEVRKNDLFGEFHVAILWKSGEKDYGVSLLPKILVRQKCEGK